MRLPTSFLSDYGHGISSYETDGSTLFQHFSQLELQIAWVQKSLILIRRGSYECLKVIFQNFSFQFNMTVHQILKRLPNRSKLLSTVSYDAIRQGCRHTLMLVF